MTESLDSFMQSKFPSQQNAIRTIWKTDISDMPEALRNLPEDRREALIASYADHIFLTMHYYPEQFSKGLLCLTSCNPDNPEVSTSYAKEGEYHVGDNLPNYRFWYNDINLSRDKRVPLFIPIERLKTDHMTDEIEYYRLFKKLMEQNSKSSP